MMGSLYLELILQGEIARYLEKSIMQMNIESYLRRVQNGRIKFI